MAKVAGISGEYFKEAAGHKGLKAVRLVKGKKEEGFSAFLSGDVHWKNPVFKLAFSAGPLYCYLV